MGRPEIKEIGVGGGGSACKYLKRLQWRMEIRNPGGGGGKRE
jgi:hypothetical protein